MPCPTFSLEAVKPPGNPDEIFIGSVPLAYHVGMDFGVSPGQTVYTVVAVDYERGIVRLVQR